MREIRPWCVSRQLWWGHQIPVWYRGDEVYVGREAPEGEGWVRDQDVLDTWFSSALWPFATLGWPERTPELERFYPTQVLSTARDIIFLWVARMVMMGVEYMGEEPFSDVYIHSVVQAADGRRMSKSLGTGIDPHRADRPARGRRPALRPGDDVEHPGRALLRRPHRPGPPARHQAVERRAPGGRPRRPGRRRRAAAGHARRPLDRLPHQRGRGAVARPWSRASSSRSWPTSSTTWSSTTTATGTWSC